MTNQRDNATPTPRAPDIKRLAKVTHLKAGTHSDHKAMCIMEAVAFVARERWSDEPVCACPVISAFLREWNDVLSDKERDEFLQPVGGQ